MFCGLLRNHEKKTLIDILIYSKNAKSSSSNENQWRTYYLLAKLSQLEKDEIKFKLHVNTKDISIGGISGY